MFTVKTDAFTIEQSQVEHAKELLNWKEGIGSWKLNKTDDIKFPMDESLLTLRDNKLAEVVAPTTTQIELTIEDEYDTGTRG